MQLCCGRGPLDLEFEFRGHDAVRLSSKRLREQLPQGEFNYIAKQVRGPYTLLIWSATSSRFDAIGGPRRDREP